MYFRSFVLIFLKFGRHSHARSMLFTKTYTALVRSMVSIVKRINIKAVGLHCVQITSRRLPFFQLGSSIVLMRGRHLGFSGGVYVEGDTSTLDLRQVG